MNQFFTTIVTWKNCKTQPPVDKWNSNLFLTDGKILYPAAFDKQCGWFLKDSMQNLPKTSLDKFWWADINEAIRINSFEGSDKH